MSMPCFSRSSLCAKVQSTGSTGVSADGVFSLSARACSGWLNRNTWFFPIMMRLPERRRGTQGGRNKHGNHEISTALEQCTCDISNFCFHHVCFIYIDWIIYLLEICVYRDNKNITFTDYLPKSDMYLNEAGLHPPHACRWRRFLISRKAPAWQ